MFILHPRPIKSEIPWLEQDRISVKQSLSILLQQSPSHHPPSSLSTFFPSEGVLRRGAVQGVVWEMGEARPRRGL